MTAVRRRAAERRVKCHKFSLDSHSKVSSPRPDSVKLGEFQQPANALPGVYLGRGTMIHENAMERPQAACWRPLLQEFKRLAPQYTAHEVGRMVRLTLATLPANLCELPS